MTHTPSRATSYRQPQTPNPLTQQGTGSVIPSSKSERKEALIKQMSSFTSRSDKSASPTKGHQAAKGRSYKAKRTKTTPKPSQATQALTKGVSSLSPQALGKQGQALVGSLKDLLQGLKGTLGTQTYQGLMQELMQLHQAFGAFSSMSASGTPNPKGILQKFDQLCDSALGFLQKMDKAGQQMSAKAKAKAPATTSKSSTSSPSTSSAASAASASSTSSAASASSASSAASASSASSAASGTSASSFAPIANIPQFQETDRTDKAKDKSEVKEAKTEKSFWEKLGDFFKKFVEVFKQIVDVLNMIMTVLAPILDCVFPGLGSVIASALELLGGVLTAIQTGNFEDLAKAALSALAKAIPYVGQVISAVCRAAFAVVKAVQQIVKAVQSGDPLQAVLGVLTAVASCAGAVGGNITKAMDVISKGATAALSKTINQVVGMVQKGVALATTAAQAVRCAVEGKWDQFAQTLGAVASQLGGLSNSKLGQQIAQGVGAGIQAVNHLAHGRYGHAIQGGMQALAPLASQSSAAKSAKQKLQDAKDVQKAAKDGVIQKGAQAVVDAAKKDSSATLQQAAKLAKPVADLSAAVKDGSLDKGLQALGGALQSFLGNPAMMKAASWLTNFAISASQIQAKDAGDFFEKLGKTDAMKQLTKALLDGSLEKGLASVTKDAGKLGKAFLEGGKWLSSIAQVASGLQSGDFSKCLAGLSKTPLSKELPMLGNLLTIAGKAESFVKSLTSGTLGKALQQVSQDASKAGKTGALDAAMPGLQALSGLIQLFANQEVNKTLNNIMTQLKSAKQQQTQLTQLVSQLQKQLQTAKTLTASA